MLKVDRTSGFTGPVSFSVPAGTTATITPASISVPGTATMLVSASATLAPGIYPTLLQLQAVPSRLFRQFMPQSAPSA